ncbi:GNAT family N-acetyltransferase [Kribbella sp. NPDC004536]|uniref:GNAT family N-acetyltransferase n=1 Tax=Kribbella sp. NPDC004536 TaxID=3364106 RepID=UPI00369BD5EE
MTTLAAILRAAEHGTFPPPDLTVSVVPAPSARESGVVAFTGHNVIAADVTAEWVAEHVPSDDPGVPMSPPFLVALAEHTGQRVGATDAMFLAPAITDPTERAAATADLTELHDLDHPRATRARRHRDDVRVYVDAHEGLVVIGRGLADRLECAIEVPPAARRQGHGRRLAMAARALVPATASIWAQITPGNAASLRTFLAAGYKPVGSEALLIK